MNRMKVRLSDDQCPSSCWPDLRHSREGPNVTPMEGLLVSYQSPLYKNAITLDDRRAVKGTTLNVIGLTRTRNTCVVWRQTAAAARSVIAGKTCSTSNLHTMQMAYG